MKIILIFVLALYSSIVFADTSYFAEVDKNNVVERVIVADSKEWCQHALGGAWIETFMNNPSKNYCSKGHEYWETLQDFVAPQPFTSWELDEKHEWKAPVEMPTDGKRYNWDEDNRNWKEQVRNNGHG